MSIENGVATGLSKVAGQASAAPGKTKAATDGPGGFAALLQGVGSEALSAQDKPVLSDTDSARQEVKADDVQRIPAEADAASVAAAMVQPNTESSVATAKTAEERASAVRATSARAQSPRGDLQAQTATQDDGRQKSLPQSEDPEARAANAGLQPLLKQAALTQRLAQQQRQADTTGAQAAVREQRGEDIAARLGWQMTERLNSPAANAPQILLAATVGESGLRSGERRQEKTERSGTTTDALAWNSPLQPDSPRLDVPAAAPDAGLMTEMRVAEQVSYWASRGGIQNAELQVDGLGEGPVKVSIALQGQEARVEFRADQVQTRQVLEDAMPHLRELLAREGLVLSGVSVGASGSDGAAGRQQQEGRKGAREAMVAVPEVQAAALPATRGAVLSGRSVDLFV